MDGYGGDGEECEIDPDLDGIPSVGLSCTLPNCFKVSTTHNSINLSSVQQSGVN